MLSYTFLLVPVILSSTLAFKKETFNLSDAISTKGHFMRETVERSYLSKVDTNDIDFHDVGNVNVLEKQAIIGKSKEQLKQMQRKKRGWGAVIFAGLNAGISMIGLGLSIAQALSEGCFYYSSICDDKKRMEYLEGQLGHMRTEYKKLYLHNRKEYVDIVTSTSNNAYISYYVNDTVKNILTLQELESFLSAKLQSKFPDVIAKYKDAEYYTSEEYLETVLGHLEYRISDIQNMLKTMKKNTIRTLLINYLAGPLTINLVTAIARFTKQGYNVWKVKGLYNQINAMAKANKDGIKWTALGKRLEIIHYGETSLSHKQVLKLRSSVSKISSSQLDKMHSKMLKHTGGKPIKAPKLSKMDVGMGVLGIISEIVSQYFSVKAWKDMADDVAKAKNNYERHHKIFQKELDKMRNESVELNEMWSDVIFTFNRTTMIFQTLINGSKNYTMFNAEVGTPQLPINTSNPFFNINFDTLNSNNIQSAQEKVISFVKEVDHDIKTVVEQMRARKELFENVLKMTELNNTIKQIFDSITDGFTFMQSKTIKEFGKSLTKKDFTCTIALLRPDLPVYDFFPLDIFRPKCNLSVDEYNQNKQISNTRRNEYHLNEIVINILNTNKSAPSLSDLTTLIKNVFSARDNADLSLFGDSLTEKDVICRISKQFPSKQEYDFISLAPFKSDCGKVDEETFRKMKNDARVMTIANSQVIAYMNACKLADWCLCPAMMEELLKITSTQLLNLIRRHVDPQQDEYCGTVPTGCKCVKLNL